MTQQLKINCDVMLAGYYMTSARWRTVSAVYVMTSPVWRKIIYLHENRHTQRRVDWQTIVEMCERGRIAVVDRHTGT